jgi:hypothetical protein
MTTTKTVTAPKTLAERERLLAEQERALSEQRVRIAAERAETQARVRQAQAEAERAVLDGVRQRIAEHLRNVYDTEQALNAVAGADTLDLQQLLTAFDIAAKAQHALAGYRQQAHDTLQKAGLDESVAADNAGGTITQNRLLMEADATGKLVPVSDEYGNHVTETITVYPRPYDAPDMGFAQYLDRVLLQRQKLAALAGGQELSDAINTAKADAASAYDH